MLRAATLRTVTEASRRPFSSTAANSHKVVAVLYPGGEFAKRQPRMLGSVENELGLREWIESKGHTLVVTSDKEGPNSVFEKELVDADIIITTPFHPGYMTPERFAKAKNLKYCITAGVGSDHINLDSANERKVGVYEVTGSNTTSVAEHAVMTMLNLVRNFVPAHNQYTQGRWDVAEVVMNSYDIQDKVVGTVGIGRIGRLIFERLKPFGIKEGLYYDYHKLDSAEEERLGVARVESLEDMVSRCDIVTINAPLYDGTLHLFGKELISKMKKGSWLVNTARGAETVPQDVADALASGHLNGYGGDVSYVQPPPKDYPWFHMKNTWNPDLGGGNAMTPHISGTSLDAQQRYAHGTKEILQNIWDNKPQEPVNVIVENGEYVSPAYGEQHKK